MPIFITRVEALFQSNTSFVRNRIDMLQSNTTKQHEGQSTQQQPEFLIYQMFQTTNIEILEAFKGRQNIDGQIRSSRRKTIN